MLIYLSSFASLACFACLAAHKASAQADGAVASPDGRVEVRAGVSAGRLVYVVRFNDEVVVEEGTVSLQFVGADPFGDSVEIENVSRRSVESSWQRLWGRRTNVANRYNELTFTLVETAAPKRRVDLVFRAYDDAAAYRYRLPEAWGSFELSAEASRLRFRGSPTVWAATYGGFHASQEGAFEEMALDAVPADSLYGLPMLFRLAPDRWAAVTEANLTDWAGMWLTRSAGGNALRTQLAPDPQEERVAVRSTAPRSSPWRAILVGDAPGDFIESDVIHNLNDPPEGDFSWVEPGIAAWNWWNGPYAPEVEFEVGMNTATMKHFVDLADEMGWRYVLIDAGWYRAASGPEPEARQSGTDITKVVPALDLHEVIRYARERGVLPVLWLHWTHVVNQMDEAFALYEEWGVAGVKIDFMDRDDQEMVNFYHRVAKRAAEHHLLVDFHGAYKPTGVSRRYPNLITREGVLGSEYNKWSTRVTPKHNVTIPFTRGMLGEMDYTPGGFRNKTIREFRPQNTGPFVMGTRAHQLAMFVVYESALQVASDSPYSYRVSPAGTDFLKIVPTTWDDTRVLAGEPGEFIAVARRSGGEWFLGLMTDEQARRIVLPLDFLGTETYTAEIWADAFDADEFPDRIWKERRTVRSADSLEARVAPGGGYVVHFTRSTP